MSTEPLPPYVYRCEDRSVLLGPYKRTIVPLWGWCIPRWLPANMITLGSSACMWLVFGLSLNVSAFSTTTVVLATLVLTQAYLAYDHLDGMQAKATGTSSALGEYLDHSLDTYHGAILTLSAFALIGTFPTWLLLVVLWSGFMAFAATMIEEKERGAIFFGWFGTIEAIFLFVLFYLSCLIPGVRDWWSAPLYGSWPAYWILVIAGGIGCVGTTADCLRRTGRLPVQLAAFVGVNLVLALALSQSTASLGYVVAVMFLHGGDYVGRVIGTHLLRRPHAWPDVVAPVLALALPYGPTWLMPLVLVWLAWRWAVGVWNVVSPLRGDWRWVNPPLQSP
jgi:phosphatidylglycerophosphate synthase